MQLCPCDSGKKFLECCDTFIKDIKIPETPEELMRSRYTAYVLADTDYIAKTMKGTAAAGFDVEHAKQWAKQIQWQSLKVIRSDFKDTEGMVEFIATYLVNGNKDSIYEISLFYREGKHWFYVDGDTPKIGRNDSCPCGSQKKFKKCCG
jgi:SEC-C motif-containing protein